MRSQELAKFVTNKTVIDIPNYSADTMETFLKFLYTDLVPKEKASTDLLRLGHRFDIGRLSNATSGSYNSVHFWSSVLVLLEIVKF